LATYTKIAEVSSVSPQSIPEQVEYVKAFLEALGYGEELNDEVVAKILAWGNLPAQPYRVIESGVLK
jgi:hypothetical protein